MKLNKMITKLAIVGSVTALTLAVSVHANVEHRGQWHPDSTTEVMQVPRRLTTANPKPAEWSPPTAGNEPGKKATRKAQQE